MLDDLFKFDSCWIISFKVAVALPILLTTTPAARLENSTASSILELQASAYPSDDKTVSPAPVTSKTSFVIVGLMRNSLSYTAIPS